MTLNTSSLPHLPNNHLAGTFGPVTAGMHHPVALLNPLSWPITREPSQATLEDTEGGWKVAWARLHFWRDTFPLRQQKLAVSAVKAPWNVPMKTPVRLIEVILTFMLSLLHCSECQKLFTLTVTNVINPKGRCLRADAAKDPAIKVQKYRLIISSPQLISQLQIKPDWTSLIEQRSKSSWVTTMLAGLHRNWACKAFLGWDDSSFHSGMHTVPGFTTCLCSCSEEQLRVQSCGNATELLRHVWRNETTKKTTQKTFVLFQNVKEKYKGANLHQLPTIPLNRKSYTGPFLPNHPKRYWVFPNPPTKIHVVMFV